jgi:nitroreductase
MRQNLNELLNARHSCRAFTKDNVSREAVEKLCKAARRAPSGANLQPGKFHVLSGAPLGELTTALQHAHAQNTPLAQEYSYFPTPLNTELKNRQRGAGFALYDALNITRKDRVQRQAQFARNYAFFDAPVGIIVTIDRNMGKGCFMDLGMALMAMLLCAEDQGLGATGIGALANYGPVVHNHLGLDGDEMVVCGIAVGVKDQTAPVNQFRTERANLDDFTSFQGFD